MRSCAKVDNIYDTSYEIIVKSLILAKVYSRKLSGNLVLLTLEQVMGINGHVNERLVAR